MSRSVLITGGTSGIGLATASLLAERGWRVAVSGSRPDRIEEARRTLPSDVLVVRADARSDDDTARLVDRAAEDLGGLDSLFLNAGIVRSRSLSEITASDWDEAFAVNARGQFLALQRTVPILPEGGAILVTAGLGILRGSPGATLAAASRGALLSIVPTLAVELAPRGIRVNAVSPGAIDTPLWDRPGMTAEQVSGAKAALAARIPAGRLGGAREVATTAAFLLSDDSSYVTGENIVVGGGAGLTAG